MRRKFLGMICVAALVGLQPAATLAHGSHHGGGHHGGGHYGGGHYGGGHHHGHNNAGAFLAGGLLLGAIAASASDNSNCGRDQYGNPVRC